MSVQLNGTTGIDGLSVNLTTPNAGNFTNINIATGGLSASTGQNLNFTTNGSQRVRVDTSGNMKLLNSSASFQDAAGAGFSPYTGFKNKVINGNFDIWQRGTSQTTSGYGSDDRWNNQHFGSIKQHLQQTFVVGQTAVPNNPKYFSRTIVTSVIGANNLVFKGTSLEDVTKSSGKTYTLSFWAKADANKNIAAEFFQVFGTGGSPSAQVSGISVTTFALTATWQKFTTTVTFPSTSGKTLGTNDNSAYGVIFYFDAGSTYNARTNSLGQQSGTFDIAQVQLEEGSTATVFEDRPLAAEMALCQRYYEQVSSIANVGYGIAAGTSGGCSVWIPFNVAKQRVPTASIAGTWAVNNCSQPTAFSQTITGARVSAVTTITGGICSFAPNSADDLLIIDAEL